MFRAQCSCFYAYQLWRDFKSESFRRLRLAYDNYRTFHKIIRFCKVCPFQIQANIKRFNTLIRKLMYHFVERTRQSKNSLVIALCTLLIIFVLNITHITAIFYLEQWITKCYFLSQSTAVGLFVHRYRSSLYLMFCVFLRYVYLVLFTMYQIHSA